MRRRTRTNLLITGTVVLLLAVLVFLRQKAPPEAARLLPESDGIVYLNLKPLRAATHFDQHSPAHEAAYQTFIDQTGFVFERDLNEAAFALHRMPDPDGPNGPVAFSEVFVGHFNGKRLTAYLDGLHASRELYAGHVIYNLANQGRTVRVALLGYDMVAVSNTPTPEQIHAILDRYRAAGLPFSGSSVLSQYYGQVPALSLAWGIGKITFPVSFASNPQMPGLRLPFVANSAWIASVRWLGSLRLRIEEIAPSPEAATETANAARALTGILTSAESNLPGSATAGDYRALLNSLQIETKGDRALVTVTIPTSLLEKLVTPPDNLGGTLGTSSAGPPEVTVPTAPAPSQPTAPHPHWRTPRHGHPQ